MAEKSTFIKLDRNILNWGWYKDANTFKVFVHLLLVANIKDGEFMGEIVKRGQHITSYKNLAAHTGLTERQVRTALNHLKATQEVTIKTTNKYTVITISNYDFFQQATQQVTNKRQTNDNQTTNERQQLKNIKNIKNEKNSQPVFSPCGEKPLTKEELERIRNQ